MTHLGGGGEDLRDVVDAVEVGDQLQPEVDLGTRGHRVRAGRDEDTGRTVDRRSEVRGRRQGRTAGNVLQKEMKKVLRLGRAKATVL